MFGGCVGSFSKCSMFSHVLCWRHPQVIYTCVCSISVYFVKICQRVKTHLQSCAGKTPVVQVIIWIATLPCGQQLSVNLWIEWEPHLKNRVGAAPDESGAELVNPRGSHDWPLFLDRKGFPKNMPPKRLPQKYAAILKILTEFSVLLVGFCWMVVALLLHHSFHKQAWNHVNENQPPLR